MESKTFLFTVIPMLGIIVIFSYLNIHQNNSVSQAPDHLDCQSIEYNGEGRIDILFISSKEDAQHYTDFFLNTEPYKSNRNYFNTYVLEGQNPECEYYKGIAILCDTKEVKDLAKKCPSDYVVVVKQDDRKIRSSSYGNIISINKAHEDSVLIHEFGHAFANLAEEYGGAKVAPGSKNCVSSCDKFNGESDSCDLECSESSYYRSIYSGVMRTLATSNYGKYDSAIINGLLEKNKPKEPAITGNQISSQISCNKDILAVNVIGSQVTTDNILQKGCAPDKGLAGPVCAGDVCNINTLFTDSQDTNSQNTLEGETDINSDRPLLFYIEQNTQNPLVDITLNNQIIKQINTAEAGATACRI